MLSRALDQLGTQCKLFTQVLQWSVAITIVTFTVCCCIVQVQAGLCYLLFPVQQPYHLCGRDSYTHQKKRSLGFELIPESMEAGIYTCSYS